MAEGVYKIIELTGSSKKDMEGAVANAVRRAHANLHGLRWFEVTDVRGYIEEGSVSYWQVTVKVGFHVDEKTEPASPASARQPQQEGARFLCTVCGYVYDPVKGDPEHGIKPGTRFEDIPDTWTCPVCGVGKDQFVEQRA